MVNWRYCTAQLLAHLFSKNYLFYFNWSNPVSRASSCHCFGSSADIQCVPVRQHWEMHQTATGRTLRDKFILNEISKRYIHALCANGLMEVRHRNSISIRFRTSPLPCGSREKSILSGNVVWTHGRVWRASNVNIAWLEAFSRHGWPFS